MPAKFSRAMLKDTLAQGLAIVILAVAISVAFRPVAGQAFTLVTCGSGTKVTVSPTSGLASASFSVDGICSPDPVCGTTLAFNFYWDTTATLIWSTKLSACNAASAIDTGPSPALKPPASGSAVGAHKVIMQVVNTATGGLLANQSTAYTINAPPPPPPPPPPKPSPVRSTPPQTHPSPTPTPTPVCAVGAVTPGCPTPSASDIACPAGSAMLPPAGTGSWGDNLIAGLVVAAVLPIAGLTLFGPGPLLAFARRRRRLLMLLGLTALTALTLSCTTVAQKPIPAPLISPPAASPSCTA